MGRKARLPRDAGDGQLRPDQADVDDEWIDGFWEWNSEIPVLRPNGELRDRAPGTVNNSVLQLAAAINLAHRRRDTLYPAAFRAKKPQDVNRTPTYRSDIDELAAMFEYALRYPEKRKNLLHFLRISVATLVRPEHAHLLNADPAKGQWSPTAAVFNLLPRGEQQTKKRRPLVPVPRQVRAWLNATPGPLIDAVSIASTWTHMQTSLKLPGEGQAGPKLVRRSMAHLARQRLDRRDVPELSMFLGHRESSATTDLYAPFDPEYLSRARAAIESVIDDIEARVPQAFHRTDTATRGKVVSIGVGKTA
jgi:integrase